MSPQHPTSLGLAPRPTVLRMTSTSSPSHRKFGIATAILMALTLSGCASGSSAAPDPDPEATEAAKGGTDSTDEPDESPVAEEAGVDEDLRAMLPESILDAGVITVAVTPTYPPYESLAEDGQTVVGQNADVMEELGRRFGVEIKYEHVAVYAATLTGIESGRYNTGIIYQATKEREAAVDMVAFYKDGLAFVGHKDSLDPGNPSLMCGKTVDVGTAGAGALLADVLQEELCTSKGLPPMELKHSTDSNKQFIALNSRRVDFITVSPGVGNMLSERTNGDIQNATPLLYPMPTAIAVDKDLPELSEALRAGLQQLIDDGTLADIFERYGTTELLVEEAVVNPATQAE